MSFKSISRTMQEMIFKLFDEGTSITSIASELRLDRNTVYKYLLQEGKVTPNPVTIDQGRKRFAEEDIQAMVSMYEDEVPLKDIQKMFDVSAPTIYRHVENAGITVENNPKGDMGKAIRMYKSGKYSVQEVLDRSGVSRSTFYKVKKEREANGTW